MSQRTSWKLVLPRIVDTNLKAMALVLLSRPGRRRTVYHSQVAHPVDYSHPVISQYLEGLVCRGLIPRPIAEDINTLPHDQLQREAVELFWARQRSWVWTQRER